MTDFRSLCAELTDTLDYWLKNSNLTDSDARDLVEEARAALAQPEPPVDGEVAELVAWLRTNADYSLQKAATATFKRFHRIADLLERLAQPEPQGPTDEELDAFIDGFFLEDDWFYIPEMERNLARAVLARWGNR